MLTSPENQFHCDWFLRQPLPYFKHFPKKVGESFVSFKNSAYLCTEFFVYCKNIN
jgi:hypothetical protein